MGSVENRRRKRLRTSIKKAFRLSLPTTGDNA
jgi:hypothetical protein